MEGKEIVGYLSVRTKPTRELIQAHDQLYKQIMAGEAKGIVIQEGRAVAVGGFLKNNPIAQWWSKAQIPARMQAGGGVALTAVAAAALGGGTTSRPCWAWVPYWGPG